MNTFGLGKGPLNSFWLGKVGSVVGQAYTKIVTFVLRITQQMTFTGDKCD